MNFKENKIEIFKQMFEKIKEYNTIIIHHHQRPDGDCIGCQMGLKYILQANFPEKRILACKGIIPEYLEFIANQDEVKDEDYNNALAIVVDTSVSSRVYDDRFKLAKEVIRFDHHDDNELDFGNILYVDETCSACSAIIADFAKVNNLIINKDAAKALYFGITTDTGRFRYRGVDGDILRSGAELIDTGIDIDHIYSHLYTGSFKELKIRGFVLRKFKQTKSGVLYMHFTRGMMKKLDIDHETAANTVNELDCIKGSLIWLTFIDQPNGEIRVRLRSRFVAINDIASEFRGGGHLCAAGATLKYKSEIKELINKLDQRMVEFKKDNPDAF